jgi:penicillin amidase
VAGINYQIETASHALPIEFALLDYAPEPFSVRDVIAILRGMWWSLNGRLENLVVAEAARLLPSDTLRTAFLTPEAPEVRIVPPGSPYPPSTLAPTPLQAALAGMGDGTGSNNWAISPGHAGAKHAMLCGDPHQPFWLPSSWYEYALHSPEETVAGAAHPGVPGLWWGVNGSIAWALTNNAASARDLYVETIDPHQPAHYLDGGVSKPFHDEQVQIAVRGGATQTHLRRSTVRGPIMNTALPTLEAGGDPPLSLRWVGMEHLDDCKALLAIGRARSWHAFRDALRDWSVAVFNFVYADHQGNIGYQNAGRVPLRGRVKAGFRDAANPDDCWQGYVPFEAMPSEFNPPRGYVASANNRVVPDDYPYPLHGAWGAGHRQVRLNQELQEAKPRSHRDMFKLQQDTKSTRAERLVPHILRHLAGSTSSEAALLRDTLQGWDFHYAGHSTAPAMFDAFVHQWQQRVAAARFPERLLPLLRASGGSAFTALENEALGWFDGPIAPQVEAAAGAAITTLQAQFGDNPEGWTWHNLHQAYWRHPLTTPAVSDAFDLGPLPVNGSVDTVGNTGTGPMPYGAVSGAEYRIVTDFANPNFFWAVQCTGNSGQPGSPHYGDQFPQWAAGQYHHVYRHRADAAADAAGLTILSPEE